MRRPRHHARRRRPIVTGSLGTEGSNPLRRAPTLEPAVVTSLGGGLFSFRTSPVTGEPFPKSSSSFIRTTWLHLTYFFFFFVFVAAPLKAVAAPAAPLNAAAVALKAAAAPAAPLKAAAALLKAAAINVRCHSCTAPDVDAPATGGLLVPRTNTLLLPRCCAPTNQFAGRWYGNACGGLPPTRALLRSLSPPWMVPRQPMPVHKSLQMDKHRLSAVDRREHRQGLQAAFTGAPTDGALFHLCGQRCAPSGARTSLAKYQVPAPAAPIDFQFALTAAVQCTVPRAN
jgi:hypothetical protein